MDELTKHIKAYLESKFEVFKFKLVKKSAPLFGEVLGIGILILMVLFILFLLNICLALFLGQEFDSYTKGFLIVASGNALVLLIALIGFRKKIKKLISNIMLRSYINSQENDNE